MKFRRISYFLKKKIKIAYFVILISLIINSWNLSAEENANFKRVGLSFAHGRGEGLRDNGYFYEEKYSRRVDEQIIRYDFSPYVAQPTGNLIQDIKTIHSNLSISFYFAKYFFLGLGFLNSSNYSKQDKNILYTFLLSQANQYTENQTLKNTINLAIVSDRILQTNYSNLFKISYQIGFIYEYEDFFMKLKLNVGAIGGRYPNPGRYFYFPSIVFGFSIYEKTYYFFLEPYYGVQTRGNLNNGSFVESGFFVGVEIRK